MLYFDHSATTPLHPAVLQTVRQVEEHHFGNPSSSHGPGRAARALLETARRQMGTALGCDPDEITFTGGGTEANNLVLWNLLREPRQHVITSAVEHPAILTVLKNLAPLGISYSVLEVDPYGRVDPQDVEAALRADTGLITIMYANNEVGTLEPIVEIAALARKHGIPFHSDGVQAVGKIPLDLSTLGVDLMSFSAHKFYGPKGVGALYVRRGTRLKPLIMGGGQEHNLRAGTENVAGIAGMGRAAELVTGDLEGTRRHLENLASRFREGFQQVYPQAIYHGQPQHHLPGLVSVAIPALPADLMLARLDRQGIAVSAGSACHSGTLQPSPVLEAMGVDPELNRCTIRISFGRDNSAQEVATLVEEMDRIITAIGEDT